MMYTYNSKCTLEIEKNKIFAFRNVYIYKCHITVTLWVCKIEDQIEEKYVPPQTPHLHLHFDWEMDMFLWDFVKLHYCRKDCSQDCWREFVQLFCASLKIC